MWDVFKDWIFQAIAWFYGFMGDWGMAIIIVTVIFRLLVSPLIHKQTKSNYQMQKINPQIQAIQKKFADDPTRVQQETQKLYAESKFNPLAGCLPMLLQIPIFMALFQVLREIGTTYTVEGTPVFYSLVPNLTWTPANAFEIDFGTFVPYLILMLLFSVVTFLPSLLMQSGDPKQRKTTMIMMVVMSIFMLIISWSSPAGVLLFWGTSSVLGVAQTQITLSILRKKDKEAAVLEVAKPVEVDVVRKVKKPRPTKKHK